MIFFPLVPICALAKSFLHFTSTIWGLISDSSHLLDAFSCLFIHWASRWKRFPMSEFIFFQTLPGSMGTWAQIFSQKKIVFKLKIKFLRFFIASRYCEMFFHLHCQLLEANDVKWRRTHLFVHRYSSSTVEQIKCQKEKVFFLFSNPVDFSIYRDTRNVFSTTRALYEIVFEEELKGFLFLPSPHQLRDACIKSNKSDTFCAWKSILI